MSTLALAPFLGKVALSHSKALARNTFVVGGAVRNHILGVAIKDIDIVIDSTRAGMDSDAFARLVARSIPTSTNIVTNNYGVAILTVSGGGWTLNGSSMKGEVIEIANARKESYGGVEGKGYKPHMVEPATIEEDLARRDFTFNTLLWRLMDIVDGVAKGEILDLLGCGRSDLALRIIRTPADPNKTFQDDPTRTIRAFKFMAQHGFHLSPEVSEAIRVNAALIHNMPWEAVANIFVDKVLRHPNAGTLLPLMEELGLMRELSLLLDGKEAASFWAKQARSFPVRLQLALRDLGFTMVPLRFLTESQIKALPGLLSSQGDEFVTVLRKPPVNNMGHITEFNLQGVDRSLPVRIAREVLIADPSRLGCLDEAIRGRLSERGNA